MSFNLQLLPKKETEQQVLDVWQHGMDEAIDQGVSFQVAKALLLTKKNDIIFFKFKTHGKKLYKEQFVEIDVTKE